MTQGVFSNRQSDAATKKHWVKTKGCTMLELNRWKSLTCAAAVATASFAVAASPAAALNPQPLPPRVLPTLGFLNPQPLPPLVD